MNRVALLLLAACPKPAAPIAAVDGTPRDDVVDVIDGVRVPDPYRWLEDAKSDRVVAWTAARNAETQAATDALPQRDWLYRRFQELWRVDDATVPWRCDVGERTTWSTKKADEDKWVVWAGDPGQPPKKVLDPNTWEKTRTLSGTSWSRDCRYLAYGVANAGDENPVVHVLDVDTGEELPDRVQGWKQWVGDWLPDGSGFYYSAKPAEGERPGENDHFYFNRAWLHRLGQPAEQDVLVLADDEVKEYWHGASVTEDGKWLVTYRGLFNSNALWIQPLGSDAPVPITTKMDAQYSAHVLGDTILVVTDEGAPNYKVMRASVTEPGQEHWTPWLPEREDEVLQGISPVGGHVYAIWRKDAITRIEVYALDGTLEHELPLPTAGTAWVSGRWSDPETRVSFSSFAFPSTEYTYAPATNTLTLLKKSPIDVDVSDMLAEQEWFTSRDGTRVPMFVIRRKGAVKDGNQPVLLTGYGGFNVSLTPSFSTTYVAWLEAGGMIAIPSLRGGGEYGQAWHEAGMRERKQNVFDDFLAAAEHLIAEGWTKPERLAIRGGSNGGLLVSAAVTQRPDLFAAVLCEVPLTDMIRYHRFGIANIWSEEYGNADDPAMVRPLLAYSPYHNAKPADYPAILVTGSDNDARTDPAHARKFFAAVQAADADHGTKQPLLLSIQTDSGHHGGVGVDVQADQNARKLAFLMAQLGMSAP